MDSDIRYQANLVRARSRNIVMTASIEGSKHLKDGVVKSKLIRSYNNLADAIVHDFEIGNKSFEASLRSIENEVAEIVRQSYSVAIENKDPIVKSLGLVAAILQIGVGGIGAYLSFGTNVYCDLMFLNGLNNAFENGSYFITGNTDVHGPLRRLYEYVAANLDIPEEYGSLAYSITDFVLSGLGLAKLSEEVKLLKTADDFSDLKTISLYRAFNAERLREYQTMAYPLLGLELFSDYNTGKSFYEDIQKIQKPEEKTPTTMDGLLKNIVANNEMMAR